MDKLVEGVALIGGRAVRGTGAAFRAYAPQAEEWLEPPFRAVDAGQLDVACRLAEEAFGSYSKTSDLVRAELLECIAEQILALGDALIVRAMAETALPRPRLEGERARTIHQLRLFAEALRNGGFSEPRLDAPLPTRQPPRPGLRARLMAVGPVAVFGASNFPLAFSVAGGDTAAALAVGCPVIVKGHPAHPGTSELVGRAVVEAVQRTGLPAGTFSLLCGAEHEIGTRLVAHPAVQAVGFTGSRRGGLALVAAAAARARPIPVFAEMSSINPVVLLPDLLKVRAEAVAHQFAASLTLGVGQFCTNPGLVLAMEDEEFRAFAQAATRVLSAAPEGCMLSPGIAQAFREGEARLAALDGVAPLLRTRSTGCKVTPSLFVTSGARFLSEPLMAEEVFGPSAVLVGCRSRDELVEVLHSLEGQLTASLHLLTDSESDLAWARHLLPVLERKAGRIVANGFPTGVEVTHAMVHGGPFPATSDGRSSSVGTLAAGRFLRPVCYQDLPQALLPEVLRDATRASAERHVAWRRLDGRLAQG